MGTQTIQKESCIEKNCKDEVTCHNGDVPVCEKHSGNQYAPIYCDSANEFVCFAGCGLSALCWCGGIAFCQQHGEDYYK